MQTHTILGIQPTTFTTKDGTRIEGSTVFVTAPLDPKRDGQGQSAERFFLSAAKLAALDFKPAPGQSIQILYNRFGKVQELRLLNDELDFGLDQ